MLPWSRWLSALPSLCRDLAWYLVTLKWRPAHAGLACVFGSTISPPVPCVQGSLTACPTRAVGFCNVDLQQVCVFSKFLLGIPHHHAVTVSTLLPTPPAADANPLRALCYLRLGLEAHPCADRLAAAGFCFPSKPGQLVRWPGFLAPPGSACKVAVSFRVAVREWPAERPKGSYPSTCPIARPTARQSPIACGLQLRRGEFAPLSPSDVRHWRALLGAGAPLTVRAKPSSSQAAPSRLPSARFQV